jgi:hypothetical protein
MSVFLFAQLITPRGYMKKNKVFKLISCISALGAIGTGTIMGISSCASNATSLKIMCSPIIEKTVGTGSETFFVEDNVGNPIVNAEITLLPKSGADMTHLSTQCISGNEYELG